MCIRDSFVAVGQDDVGFQQFAQPHVGGVAAVAVDHDMVRFRPRRHEGGDRGERGALPGGVQLAPAGDAVDVHCLRLLRQGQDALVIPFLRRVNEAPDLEAPAVPIDARDGTCLLYTSRCV